jgi:sterol desaturase/sphingolipid hydroxylase (fatty acid hydroxylase superfamily)
LENPGSFILSHEPQVRLAAFAAIVAAMGLWELLTPRRPRTSPRRKRWPFNLGIAALNTVLLRVIFPTAAVGVAMIAAERGWGLLNLAALPQWLAALIAVVVLDLGLYGQHVAFHKSALLWRLHRLHHADVDVDLTTGARFHPLEIVLSMVLKMGMVVALGAPPGAVVIFEVLLNANSMFNHANVRLPETVDRLLRIFIVTPDMHRVHHSVLRAETDSNYGFQLACWDKIFGTYRAQPLHGHTAMQLGAWNSEQKPADS